VTPDWLHHWTLGVRGLHTSGFAVYRPIGLILTGDQKLSRRLAKDAVNAKREFVNLRINGVSVTEAKLHSGKEGVELVFTNPLLGEFTADESFTFEL